MNRIVLIGNGFDLAHGLKTGYTHFMDWYWTEFAQKYPKGKVLYEDEFITFENKNGPKGGYEARSGVDYRNDPDCKIFISFVKEIVNIGSYADLKSLIEEANEKSNLGYTLSFKNNFFGHISDKTCLQTWLDIENEYYEHLKSILSQPKDKRNALVRKLNEEFGEVKNLLEKYLTEVCKNNQVKPKQHVFTNIICAGIKYEDIAIAKRKMFLDSIPDHKNSLFITVQNAPEQFDHFRRMSERQLDGQMEESIRAYGVTVQHTLLLNFNYTDTVIKLFGGPDEECDYEDYHGVDRPLMDVINIHGELNNPENPIIFGYGDEIDEHYKKIAEQNENKYLNNIKSIRYLETDNYRRLLTFIDSDPYQIYIMGHSCGNSDRTLLNTLFEHKNCVSIKPFYHKESETKDDYIDIVQNISRNFKNPALMRDRVVNKTYCEPLPQNPPVGTVREINNDNYAETVEEIRMVAKFKKKVK